MAKHPDLKTRRLMRRALTGNWETDSMDRAEMLRGQIAIANDPEMPPRERSRAAEVVRKCVADDTAKLLKMIDKVAPDQHAVEHSGAVQVYLPDNGRDAAPARQVLPGVNGNGNGQH